MGTKMYRVTVDGQDVSTLVALPIRELFTLDESLDSASLRVRFLTQKEPFKPLSKVKIRTYENKQLKSEQNYLIAVDNVVEYVALKRYDHDLQLIEYTKWLERFVVDTCRVTNPLVHDYVSGAANVYVTQRNTVGTSEETTYYYSSKMKDIALSNTTVPSLMNFFDISSLDPEFTYNMALFDSYNEQVAGSGGIENEFVPDEPLVNGTYTVQYNIITKLPSLLSTTFQFNVISQSQPLQDYSIRDVVEKLLIIAETTMGNPRFKLNTEQAQKYGARNEDGTPVYPAPEFSFTRSTLRECLDQVASYIHAIVRLKPNDPNDTSGITYDGYIYFDELGGTDEITLPENYIGQTLTQDIEQYCTNIDTNAENLVNVDNINIGSITEPFISGYKTLRAETGTIRINEETGIIETEYPIEKIVSLKVGYLDNETTPYVGDITPYVYEENEYLALSSFEDTYPYSKAYAIYYTQGENNIKGLNFKLPDAISPAFQQYSIINILERKTNNSGVANIITTPNYPNLNFQITYIPIVSARVKQSKSNLNDYDNVTTIIYNQTANKLDSEAFGESLKGVVERFGNIEKTKTYILPSKDKVPKVGQIVDEDYYIATVDIENLTDFVKCTIGLAKDFNRWNKYVGIKNNVRQYEISERQTVERNVIYEDYCVIGYANSGAPTTNDCLIVNNSKPLQIIRDSFFGSSTTRTFTPVSMVEATGYTDDEDGVPLTALTSVVLPCISIPIGNSLLFAFKYKDNYSAGNTSQDPVLNPNTTYYRVQNYVPYADTYGRIQDIHVSYYGQPKNVTNYSDAVSVGNSLPLSFDGIIDLYFGTVNLLSNRIHLLKDGAENINFSYQLNFITDDKKIIIGRGLSKNIGLVTSEVNSAKLYVLPTRLEKFSTKIDLTNATLIKDYSDGTVIN